MMMISIHFCFSDAPKISQSSCNRSDIITCFCEVDGNPAPTLEWHLSGRPVVNSTSTSIFQERLGDTNFRTTLTVNQPLTDTPTLQCVSANTHGNASQFQELQPPPSREIFMSNLFLWNIKRERTNRNDSRSHSLNGFLGFDGLLLMAGVVISVIVMLIVGIVSLFCMRWVNHHKTHLAHDECDKLDNQIKDLKNVPK